MQLLWASESSLAVLTEVWWVFNSGSDNSELNMSCSLILDPVWELVLNLVLEPLRHSRAAPGSLNQCNLSEVVLLLSTKYVNSYVTQKGQSYYERQYREQKTNEGNLIF